MIIVLGWLERSVVELIKSDVNKNIYKIGSILRQLSKKFEYKNPLILTPFDSVDVAS